MREIKFRAWDDYEKDMGMVEGIDWIEETLDMSIPNYCIQKRMLNEMKLMQYTGLKDCNDTEIYEGDIVEKIYGDRQGCIKVNGSIKPFLYVVEERYGCFGISPVFSEMVHPDDRRWIPIYDQEDEELKTEYLTVVGNIYEGSEMME